MMMMSDDDMMMICPSYAAELGSWGAGRWVAGNEELGMEWKILDLLFLGVIYHEVLEPTLLRGAMCM